MTFRLRNLIFIGNRIAANLGRNLQFLKFKLNCRLSLKNGIEGSAGLFSHVLEEICMSNETLISECFEGNSAIGIH